jgi:hypothetical protein
MAAPICGPALYNVVERAGQAIGLIGIERRTITFIELRTARKVGALAAVQIGTGVDAICICINLIAIAVDLPVA